MTAVHWRRTIVLLIPLALTGCRGGDQPTAAGKEFPIKGTVIAVDSNKPSVNLDHEEIPRLMKAMKMDYAVADAKLLHGIKAGDAVQGQLKVESGKYVITRLEKR
jgi:Cu/Ag efflux protein CusF